MTKKYLVVLLSVFCSSIVFGQDKKVIKKVVVADTSWQHADKNCHHLLSNTFQCNWSFYNIKSFEEGVVIACNLALKDKKGFNGASAMIIKTKSDTIRVLHMDYNMYKAGAHIKILPMQEPDTDVAVPFDREYYLSEERKGHKPVCRINEYDARILKTTWGKIAAQ